MKKNFKYLSIMILTNINAQKVINKSFFSVADFYHFSSLGQDQFFKESNQGCKLRVTGLYAHSTDSSGLARYFGPFDKSEYVVKEDLDAANIDNGNQDILSYNFNLVTQNGDYHSIIRFKPSWSVSGAVVHLLLQRCKSYWLSFQMPVVHVKNNMHLDEQVINSGGGSINNVGGGNFSIDNQLQASTMKEAFKNSAMRYGKIDGSKKKTRLSHIRISGGYNAYTTEKKYLQLQAGLTIPTGNKPNSHYLFEPIVGNNKHYELIAGINWGKYWRQYNQKQISIAGALQTVYACPNTQVRSFDPGGKPWGRYLAVASNKTNFAAGTYQWGMHQFTKKVRVHPHFTHTADLFMKINYQHKYAITFGYTAQIQSGETVNLYDDWFDPAITSLVDGSYSVPSRGINILLDDTKDTVYIPVESYQLDLATAAHVHHTNHIFKTLVEWKSHRWDNVLGGSYTTAHTNAGLHAVSIWLSFSTQF